jgi:hypothetical protein
MRKNIVTARVEIIGTRPLWQHQFGPDALPLEKQERTGVAGNDPEEWKRTCSVMPDGQLYIPGTYFFSMLRDAARHTKKGRGSIQPLVAATLLVQEDRVLLNRFLPNHGSAPTTDSTQDVYIDVRGVRNPSTKARNVRYRLAVSPGWKCSFSIMWDKTLVSRDQMRAVVEDAGRLVGLSNGRSIGYGRFDVVGFAEQNGAEETSAS